MDMMAKKLNLAIPPQKTPVVEQITATELSIRRKNLTEAEAEQLRIISHLQCQASLFKSHLAGKQNKL